MKRFLLALAFALAACNGAGTPPPVPTPEPTPTPIVTPTPAPACGSTASGTVRDGAGPVILRPRNATRAKGGQLSYGGGPVIAAAKVYVVLWGFDASDPIVQRYIDLYSNVGGSSWLSTVEQYCQSPATYITNPTGMLAAAPWSDMNDPVPAAPKQADIANEAQIAASHFGISDPIDAQVSIVVATPHGVVPQGFEKQYCAYHDNVGALSYTLMPYIPDAGAGCGAEPDDALAGVSIVGGHELAESITDPEPPSGWTGPGGEIADECAWKDIERVDLNGVSLYMQPLWSNSAGACVQQG